MNQITMPHGSSLQHLVKRFQKRVGSPHGALFIILIAMLVLQPFLGGGAALRWFLDVTGVLILIAAILVTQENRKILKVMLALGIPAVVASFLGRSLSIEELYPISAGLRAVFYTFLIIAIFADILRRQSITIDAVFGASAAYVLLGVAWGSIFAMLEWLQPGSFRIADDIAAFGRQALEFELNYYSIITLTSVGYGDITPVSPTARMLASIEGLVGQLYLAIVIASLVGIEVSSRVRKSS